MREKYLEIEEDLLIHYLQWSELMMEASMPPVLLLHGFGSTAFAFVEMAEELSEKSCVFAVDLPGHGESAPLPSYTLKQFCSWMNKVIRKLCGERKPIVVGHSIGADIILNYHSVHPESMEHIILLDGGYLSNQLDLQTSQKDAVDGAMQFHSEYKFKSWDEFIHDESTHTSRWNDRLEQAARSKMIMSEEVVRLRISRETVKGYMSLFHENEGALLLNEIDSPANLLVSTLPKEANVMRDKALDRIDNPLLKVKKIPDAGHDVFVDNLPVAVDMIIEAMNGNS